jgi:hypothetical protein
MSSIEDVIGTKREQWGRHSCLPREQEYQFDLIDPLDGLATVERVFCSQRSKSRYFGNAGYRQPGDQPHQS